MLNTLGVAQYRVGEYEEALNTLRQSDRLNRGIPADRAFIAMSLYQLDQKNLAQDALASLRVRIEQSREGQDAHAFLREATELIEGTHPD